MLRKLNVLIAGFAFVLLMTGLSAMAQGGRNGDAAPRDSGTITVPNTRAPALGCCKCLGGSNTLDLSTNGSNAWTVNNGNPTVVQASPHPAWNLNTNGAKWVSTAANGSSTLAPGTYDYKLTFVVPECVISQSVTLKGKVGGDDDVQVFFDNTSNALTPLCAGWCFNTQNPPPPFTQTNIGPGPHTLIIRVKNGGGPSGMFVNAQVTGACSDKPTK